MKNLNFIVNFVLLLCIISCNHADIDDFRYKKIPYSVTLHRIEIQDPYHWMEDSTSRGELLTCIGKENENVSKVLKHIKKLEKQFRKECDLRHVVAFPDAETTKSIDNEYIYYEREEGESILYCRKSKDGIEQILLDSRKDSEGLDCNIVENYRISPDGEKIAYTIYDGNDLKSEYFLRLKTLKNNVLYEDQLENIWDFHWLDHQTIIYARDIRNKNVPKTVQIFKHTLGTPQNSDILVYNDNSSGYDIDIRMSDSKKYVFISACNNSRSEHYLYDCAGNKPVLIDQCNGNGFYWPDHYGNDTVLYVFTNKDAPNRKLATMTTLHPKLSNLKDIVPESDRFILDICNMGKYILLREFNGCSIDLTIIEKSTARRQTIPFDEPAHNVEIVYTNTNHATIRLKYNSYITPDIYYDYHIEQNRLNKVFETEVTNYNRENYEVKLLYAPSHDGLKIPMTLVYNKYKVQKGIPAPVTMSAYGAWGQNKTPVFDPAATVMMDHGFYFVAPEVRGGGGIFSDWHRSGIGINKKNAVYDVVAVVNCLIAEKYTSAGNIYLGGGSAGGLVAGMAINMFPELFGGITMFAPKLDVLFDTGNTAWSEYGNPDNEEQFKYMLEYSPYQNVKKQAYPPLLLMHGMKDTRVPCFETLKMVARLREYRTNRNPLLMNIYMEGDHFRLFSEKDHAFTPFLFELALHNGLLYKDQ